MIKAYQGAGRPVRVPFRGRRLKKWKRRHNTTHAKIRCLGEQAMATLKSWRLLRKLRCSTNRITDIVKGVLVLHHASINRSALQTAIMAARVRTCPAAASKWRAPWRLTPVRLTCIPSAPCGPPEMG